MSAPRQVTGVQLERLPLVPEQAFVFSRVDGTATVADIAISTGLTAEQVSAALARLAELGAISGFGAAGSNGASVPRSSGADGAPRSKATTPDEPATPSEGELSPSEQTLIESKYELLASQNHYDVLEVHRLSGRDEIRAAYHELSKRFHPDRFYGRPLGSHERKLTTVFQRLSEAYDVLGRKQSRIQYDAILDETEGM